MKTLFFKSNLKSLSSQKVNKFLPKLNYFSSSSSDHHHEEDLAPKKFDHIRYMRKLNQQERREEGQDVLLYDTLNEDYSSIRLKTTTFQYQEDLMFKTPVLMPYEKIEDEINSNFLDRSEIEARIYNLLRQFDYMDLEKFDFSADYEKELGLDSLDWTAILTSIEYEFHTVFNDTFYEHWRCIKEVVDFLEKDSFLF